MAAMRTEQMAGQGGYTADFSGDVMAVDAYLQYAEQCVALAARSSSPADKARLLQMAQAWRDLAAKHDNGMRKDPDSRQ
jgi:hypothetical protein